MDDIAKNFPNLTAGLRKASERLKTVNADPDWNRELEKLREYIRDELQSVRDFGIDGIPGFDDDAPGDMVDLCKVVGIDPHCRFDELLAAVREWALRRQLEARVDAAAVKTADGPEWSAWFRKADLECTWKISAQKRRNLMRDYDGTDHPTNQQWCRFPLEQLKKIPEATSYGLPNSAETAGN